MVKLTRDYKILWLVILTLGLVLRLIPAYLYYGSGDVNAWEKFSTYWQDKRSPYDESHRYNYSPAWFWIISLMQYINLRLHLPFSFIVKMPLILTDVLILFLILSSSKRLKLSAKETLLAGSCFFLNPVSILISGYHGQFDNISLFLVLLAWYLYTFIREKGFFWLSVLAFSTSVGIKHFTIMLTPIFSFAQKSFFRAVALFITAPSMFIIIIIPYLIKDSRWVINNVFHYNLHAGYWGWSGIICRGILFFTGVDLIKQPWFVYMDYFNYLVYIFILIISFFLVRRYDLLDSIILVFLIFYCFTTQIAPQYTIWIIPFAALKRGKFFYAYSIVGALQLMAFFYCHYRWFFNKPFIGTLSNLTPEIFIVLRYLTWLVCVLWLVDKALDYPRH